MSRMRTLWPVYLLLLLLFSGNPATLNIGTNTGVTKASVLASLSPAPGPANCAIRGFAFKCFGAVISVTPKPVVLGGTMTLTVSPASGYSFDGHTVIVLEPMAGVGLGVGLRTLCGGLRGGAPNTPCPAGGKTMTLSVPNDGSLPAGRYLLRAENWEPALVVGRTTACSPACTEADAGLVQFGSSGSSVPPPPPQKAQAPFITSLSLSNHAPGRDQCVQSQPSTVTINVQGQNFDPNGAQIIVSYIYFVDHGTFRTDFHGRDSRVAANITQRRANFLEGSVDLRGIHQRGGDPFGLGGNYYVQVQNGDGQVNPRAPFYFTALPYQGPDSRCR